MRAWCTAVLAVAAAVGACRSRPLDPIGQGMIAGAAGRAGGGDGTGVGGDTGVVGSGGGVFDGGVAPTIAVGAPCVSDSQCLSGFCVDGVCCVSGCTNGCATCNLPNFPGTCITRAAGIRPRTPETCPAEPPSSCGRDGTCDGQGGCRLWQYAPCGGGVCDGDSVVNSKACDGLGVCRAAARRLCTPYRCDPDTGSCRTDCATNDDCSGTYCEATGRCHVNNTEACQSNSECASGFCSGGVCCDSICTGACMSCTVAGHEGRCSAWPGCAASTD